MRAVYLRPRANLRALVVIPGPTDAEQWPALARIDPAREEQRARANLGGIPVKVLSGGGKASLQSLGVTLQANEDRGGFDILYLVCHGSLEDKAGSRAVPGAGPDSVLLLESEAGTTERVAGTELVQLLRDRSHRPRLVVLASCQSGGAGNERPAESQAALAAIGPRLAAAGIPAVVAMQGDVRQDSAEKFLESFFGELAKHGQVDRGVAVARRQLVHDGHRDWWVPVLISRLDDCCIWQELPAGGEEEFSNWDVLVSYVNDAACTPILGPDLAVDVWGSQLELAQEWAKKYNFPMAASEQNSLPQVAQYVEHMKGRKILRQQLQRHVKETLIKNFGEELPTSAQPGSIDDTQLGDLFREIGKVCRKKEAEDPYWVLARMPFSVYVTSDRHSMLFDALCEAPDPRDPGKRKEPRWDVCRWAVFQETLEAIGDDGEPLWPESIFASDPAYKPSVSKPLVFHAFGHMEYPDTLVLTEDDYFDYLIGIMKNTSGTRDKNSPRQGTMPVPQPVLNALSLSGLLFLGFRLSDWEFRTLFRHILAQEKTTLRDSPRGMKELPPNVSVQLAPSEQGGYLVPQGARTYLERYLTKGYHVDIAWSRADAFVKRLYEIWDASKQGPTAKGADP
jgi:hypothetical protein